MMQAYIYIIYFKIHKNSDLMIYELEIVSSAITLMYKTVYLNFIKSIKNGENT